MESQSSSYKRQGGVNLLIADRDEAVRSACVEIAKTLSFEITLASDLDELEDRIKSGSIDIALVDLSPWKAGRRDALNVLEAIVRLSKARVIVMSTSVSMRAAVEAIRHGAFDYLLKPFSLEELVESLKGAMPEMQEKPMSGASQPSQKRGLGPMVSCSPQMEKVYQLISRVAKTAHPVLILGESGTGKELIAHLIHDSGPNCRKPFLPVDCGSLVPTLIESELFGYVKGAFTGASHSKEGLLVAAQEGTVFLDEIGELPIELQAKLLRALQEREVRPVGGTHRVKINARIIAATNRDLASMVEMGTFRKDLFYRLNVVNIRVPALRDRQEDIPVLASYFLERLSRGSEYVISEQALNILAQYDWPGNVRELEHALERACALSSGPILHLGDLPTKLQSCWLNSVPHHSTETKDEQFKSLALMEKEAILQAIESTGGDRIRTARLLGIGKTTLYRKLKEYGV